MTLQQNPPVPAMAEAPAAIDTQLPAYTAEEEKTPEYSQAAPSQTNPFAPSAVNTTTSAFPSAAEEKARLRASVSDAGSHPLFRNGPEMVSPAADGAAGHATMEALSRGLQVPTSSRLVTSGFPYPDALAAHGVTPADWARFTSEITNAARMKPADWVLSIGGSTGTLLVAGLVIGWLGLIPAVFVGRKIHEKREAHNLAEAKQTGGLEGILLSWNKDFFAPRGVLVRVDLPGEAFGLDAMDVHKKKRASCGSYCRRAPQAVTSEAAEVGDEKLQRRVEKIENKLAKVESKLRRKAARKGRIVLMPISKSFATPVDDEVYGSSVV
ncbi:MAG: hypothetical protein M1832_004671 [Thelocarpon impressellum]|nr:MAG: hypothetical protein M1832_004671 [Thelocarpon impressellum]